MLSDEEILAAVRAHQDRVDTVRHWSDVDRWEREAAASKAELSAELAAADRLDRREVWRERGYRRGEC